MITSRQKYIELAIKELHSLKSITNTSDTFTKLCLYDKNKLISGKKKSYELGKENYKKDEEVNRKRSLSYIK